MASKLSSRAFSAVSSSVRARPACTSAIVTTAVVSRRGLSTESAASEETAGKPRWSYTPPGAKAPFSLRINSRRPDFPVNEDPAVLDQFYIRMLGNGGDKLLSDEIKWLAVTHKSFDQGRRGFNDRLAFLGKRIVQLQASLALVQDAGNFAKKTPEDPYGRKPFQHQALEGLSNLSTNTKSFLTSKTKLAELAQKYELQNVIRWSPRKPNNLQSSGIDVVLAHTLYAVVGAVALEKGGHVANKVAQERILAPLGLRSTLP
ncbi:hypothetical protein DTO166G4_1269 [Paecilomyces variotii]|nr:hypothetical protein DTO032I3_1763 [Paecilomyces variotii]KAJ9207240.1 hypothetical protein DTO164E3_514 [Paecilomyces variotii]KAJ9217214.1 hypothetical protein DTO166G4_1269 [Paecilomyces variotii]KAJ9227305.1 hypothetical protein DTO169C6_526 [Paecilomyces variotii]KAJ9240286.1 hypothetical protein DTO169E5_4074 [Paecilomyces variotii]